jgi:hypothetical protein
MVNPTFNYYANTTIYIVAVAYNASPQLELSYMYYESIPVLNITTTNSTANSTTNSTISSATNSTNTTNCTDPLYANTYNCTGLNTTATN